jgi:hypothetical protein
MLVAFIRQNYPGELNRKNQAGYFTKDKIQPLLDFIKNRFINQKNDCELFESEIKRLADEWEEKISQVNLQKYDEILLKPGEHDGDNEDWILMQSMREVDTNTYIQIKGNK